MAFALVQDDTGTASGVGDIDVTFSSSATSGNLVVVHASSQDTGGTESATCTVGGTAATAIATVRNANLASGWRGWNFYLVLAASGSHTVNVNFGGTPNFIRATIMEFSGNAASSVLDKNSTGTGNSTTPSSGSVTPDSNGQLIVGYAITGSGTIAAGTGFTSTQNVDGFDEGEYQEQASAAAISADFTADSEEWLALVATFRAPSSGDAVPVCWAQYRTRRN